MHCEMPLLLLLLALVITACCDHMLNLQVDAYNDSLWNGNVNDATLECTCVGFFIYFCKLMEN